MEQFKKYLISADKNMNIINTDSEFLLYIGKDKVKSLDQIIPPQDLLQLRNSVFAIDPGNLCLTCFRIRTANGRLNWIAANVEKEAEGDEIIHMELTDIQTLKSEGVLAHYDEMTGLLNRQAIVELALELTQQQPSKSFFFALLDIDHFKDVNDTFGHMCGDEVIVDIAHIVRNCVGSNGKVGRVGGDEFMVVLEHVNDKQKAREIFADIREAVEVKYKQYKGSMDITISIGAALFPDYASSYDDLFHLVDMMLYRAKTKGRNRYIIYTPLVHGDVLGMQKDAVTEVVAYHAASAGEKLHLMLEFLTSFLHRTDISIQTALEKMLGAYDLDEVYLIDAQTLSSEYGVHRKIIVDGKSIIENCEKSMPYLKKPVFQKLFNENNVAIANIYDLHKEEYGEIIRCMEDNDQRFMVVYHMTEARKEGYMVFANHKDSACRLSDADILDLIYFGHMMEITSNDR